MKPTTKNKRQNRAFKGIWIPKEIWLNSELSLQEKVFIVEIDSLSTEAKGCFATNEHFSKFFGISKRRVSIVINSLVKKGLVKSEITAASGNKRILTCLWNKSSIPSAIKVPEPIEQKFHTLGNKTGIGIAGKFHSPYKEEKNNNQTNEKYNEKYKENNSIVESAENILGLDLQIANARNFFCRQIEKIFYLTVREKRTFAGITKHIIQQCQNGKLEPAIFNDAVEWARQAKASNVANKKGLFVAKVKEQTGYRGAKKLLKEAV